MGKSAFVPADILVPDITDMEDWSVVACDQFTSEREYWDRVSLRTEGKLSTMHMIFPEAYLEDRSALDAAQDTNAVMEHYLESNIFRTLSDSFVYVEREVSGGVRKGLVGALDLEYYDYRPGSDAPVRASERTVAERLPARMLIRESAPLELPHAMVLIDDAEKSVIEPLHKRTDSLEKLYDFELMEGGGRIRGWQVPPDKSGPTLQALEELAGRDIQMIVGDGNHSLAAAKELWNRLRQNLTPECAAVHPARYALVELNNVYDPGVCFEPIHRIVFNLEPEKLLEVFREKLVVPGGREIECVVDGRVREKLPVRGRSFGDMVDSLQSFLEEYAVMVDGTMDYIHDRDALLRLTRETGSIGFLLPAMEKSEFFESVACQGIFPKKSFSIGHARDKRYYLECRRIR